MAAEKKGLLMALLAPKKPMGDMDDEKPMGDTGDEEAKKLAAQGILQALKDEDSDALSDALSTFMDACKSYSETPSGT